MAQIETKLQHCCYLHAVLLVALRLCDKVLRYCSLQRIEKWVGFQGWIVIRGGAYLIILGLSLMLNRGGQLFGRVLNIGITVLTFEFAMFSV